MLKEERLKDIAAMLQTNGRVEVANLCRIFNVTEMTIRRDLNDLAEQEIAVRSHGGAILAPDTMLTERPYELRISHNLAQKEAIAREALPFIHDGDRVYFDSSTTAYCLARLIPNAQKFLAVTDTLATAIELNARSNVKVVCLGGELKKTTGSCTGTFADSMLKTMHFNTAFIGLPRISPNGVLSTSSMGELTIKRSVLERSSQVVILVDSSKLGNPDFLEIGHISEVDVLITDERMPQEFVRYCQSQNVRTIVASLDSAKAGTAKG